MGRSGIRQKKESRAGWPGLPFMKLVVDPFGSAPRMFVSSPRFTAQLLRNLAHQFRISFNLCSLKL